MNPYAASFAFHGLLATGIQRTDPRYYSYVTLDLVSAVFVIILICYSLFKFERRNRGDYYFSLLGAAILLLLLFDIPQTLCRSLDETWFPAALGISSFFQFAIGAYVSLIYTNYLAYYLGIELRERRLISRWMIMIGAFDTFLCLLNLRFGFYYSITETNDYVRGDFWIVSQIIASLPIIFDIVLFMRHRRSVYSGAWVGTALYILLPLVGAGVQFVTEYPLTYFSMGTAYYMLFFNIKTEQTFRMEKQQKELAESRISIMLSQIQPHFMYNALTTIASLCEKNPSEAKRATMDFSRYLRKNLDSVNKRMPVPFKSELEHVQTYLELEKLRFGDRLRVVLDIQATDFLVPPLTIQPLAENAVKHGICSKPSGEGTLTIRSRESERGFEVIIEDDGIGFDKNVKHDDGRDHIGLSNVRSRLETMANAQLLVDSVVGKGTVVTVIVPKHLETGI